MSKLTIENAQYLFSMDPRLFVAFCRKCQFGSNALKLKWFHRDWITMFHENKKSLLLSFRGSLKSTLAVDYVLHRAIYHWPEKQLIVTENSQNVEEFFGQLQSITGSDLFKSVYPNFKFWDKDKNIYMHQLVRFPWQKSIVRNPNKKSPTIAINTWNTSRTGFHIDTGVLLLDDSYASTKIYGRTMWDRAVRTINNVWMSMCNDPKIIITGTRYSDQDPYGELIISGIPWNEHTKSIFYEGEPMWPERWPLEKIEEKRDALKLNSIDFALQFENNVELSRGRIFTSGLLVGLLEDPNKLDTLNNRDVERFYGVDMAYGGKDKTSVVCAYLEKTGDSTIIYLHPEINYNYKPHEVNQRFEDIARVTAGYPTYIESNGPQSQNVSILRENYNHYLVQPYNPKVSKYHRAKELIVAMEREEVRIIDNDARELYNQMLSFTGEDGGQDDLVDAAVMAWKMASEQKRRSTGRPIKLDISRKRRGIITPNRTPRV